MEQTDQLVGQEGPFSRGSVHPPRVGKTHLLATAGVQPLWNMKVTKYKKKFSQEVGSYEQKPTQLYRVVNSAHQDALAMRNLKGTASLTDVQLSQGLEQLLV